MTETDAFRRTRTQAEAMALVFDEMIVEINLPTRDGKQSSRIALVADDGYHFSPVAYSDGNAYATFAVPHGRYRCVGLDRASTTI